MRSRILLACGLVLALAGCTSLDHQPGEDLMAKRPGTVVTDGELQARGEWTIGDRRVRRLLGPTRGQVRLASQERAMCDVIRVGRHELVLPSVSAALTRITGLAYEPRYYRTKTAWILLRRDKPAFVIEDDPEGSSPDDASPEVFAKLGHALRDQVEGLEAIRPAEPTN